MQTEDEIFIVLAYHADGSPVVIGAFSRYDLVQSAMRGYADDCRRSPSSRGAITEFTVHPASFNQHGLAPETERLTIWHVLKGED